ncbi:6-phospho-3-hexuloisomerase [Goodfellowiella coeruleoviolacea]|uniref:6-phospho-3-hexuloisomerase n=1 Tax=Goodfellowiella coeruleoviolacea TaxID=334858 RepID=A0AAE3G7K7_9PSEU|nr:6-phospho-3-hexuloisomerase [Goodfellowiella coeruleoviolacea]MCP2163181.1 6-phospho-3-hexuloisomerase [Goodfellowiella coeruleoviolacea]
MVDPLDRARSVLTEVHRAVTTVDPTAVTALSTAITAARAVFFDARGRSGLVARALAMRWMHLGLRVHVAGETTTPAIGAGDLLVCLSASGRTAGPLTNAGVARARGARVGVLTAAPNSPLAAAADVVVVVAADSHQHGGSLFEQACLLLGDAMCGAFQHANEIPDAALDERHANLL